MKIVRAEIEEYEILEIIEDRLTLNIFKGIISSEEFTDSEKIEIMKGFIQGKEKSLSTRQGERD